MNQLIDAGLHVINGGATVRGNEQIGGCEICPGIVRKDGVTP
jgi:hypothetical protein